MIEVDRPAQPRLLAKRAAQWCQRLLTAREAYHSEKSAHLKRAVERAEEKYRHEEVKQALVAMFHGKCAYCESKITHVDYGHIEHYRPKSRYPGQTFTWGNLFLACGVCNGPGHKADLFPSRQEGGPLVNPCDDEPERHFEFRYDPEAQLASIYGRTRRGRTTVKVLGLNRPELRAYRSRQFRLLLALARLARQDEEARALVEQAKQADQQYTAFARHLPVAGTEAAPSS